MRQNILENAIFYNNMSLEEQKKYVKKIYTFYEKHIPLIRYSNRNVKYALKHDFDNVYIFYTNHITVEDYSKFYQKNYGMLLDNYIKDTTQNAIYNSHKLNHNSFEINPLIFQQSFIIEKHTSSAIQTIINTLEINDICMIDFNKKGVNLLTMLNMEHNVKKYINIEENTKLITSYKCMIRDMSKNSKKYKIINDSINNVYFFDIINNTNIIFYNAITENNENLYNTLYIPICTLAKDGYLIICVENNDKIINEIILKNNKINYDRNIKINGINYLIFKKVTDSYNYLYIKNKPNKKILAKLEENNDNPPLNIININVDSKHINIIQDSTLITGTKQRAVIDYLKKTLNNKVKHLVYASGYNGYGSVNTGYGAYKLNKTAWVFLNSVNINNKEEIKKILKTKQLQTLMSVNAKIFLCDSYKTGMTLKYEISTIPFNENWKKRENFEIPDMGFHDTKTKMFVSIMKNKMKLASINTIINDILPLRIWMVAGSGGICEAVHLAFPHAKIFVFLTGYAKFYYHVIKWAKKIKNIVILNDNKDYVLIDENNDYEQYYKSVKGYDSMIFPYVKQYALNNDFIWNVASD